MKLFGSSSGKRQKLNDAGLKTQTQLNMTNSSSDTNTGYKKNLSHTSAGSSKRSKMSTRKKIIIAISSVLGAGILAAGITLAIIRYEIQPFYDFLYPKPKEGILADMRTPRVPRDPNNPDYTIDPNMTPPPLDEIRSLEKISFLILGLDKFSDLRSQGGSNTDVIMVATFNMQEQKLEVASIPRDTIANVPWNVKKINTIWANMVSKHRNSDDVFKNAVNGTMDLFADFLGFNLDFCIMLDMQAFVKLVDSLPGNGIKYTLQNAFHFDDPDIGLNITLPAGENIVNGEQALALMRFRGYRNGDFGRINTQQQFLSSAAKQILSQSNQISLTTYVDIFFNNIQTNMDLSTIIRIGRELLKLDPENINFSTAPCTITSVQTPGYDTPLSYVYVDVDEWLEIINTKLNTFYEDITPYHVSILTRGSNNRFYVTDDHWQGSRNWGS